MKSAIFFQSFARYYARQSLWEIIPYLAGYTIAKLSGWGIKRVSFLYRRNRWRKFCSRKPVFAKLLEGDFRFDIRARCQKEGWMSMGTLPIQLAPQKGYEKSWGRQAPFCNGWISESFCLNYCLYYSIGVLNKSVTHRIPQTGLSLPSIAVVLFFSTTFTACKYTFSQLRNEKKITWRKLYWSLQPLFLLYAA